MKIISLKKGRLILWYTLISVIFLYCPTIKANPTLSKLPNQQLQITGTITDGTLPLAGVTIKVKGATTSVVSDFDGKYSITAHSTDTLIFSYLGYKTIELIVGNRKVIDVKMFDDTTSLREVTVNAGYYKVKDKERTGSISKIGSKDIEKQPVTNVLAAMQGRMAGVNITQNTGVAGGGFDIQIRGQNSLRSDGNRPLYIIDGVPYSSDAVGSDLTGIVLPGPTSPLNSINPTDIESIEVLKDADATAIYGSRGANGVVLITTKKGKEGKTRFTANVSGGFGSVTRLMKLMDTQQYLQMRKEAFVNDGILYGPADYDVNGTWDQNRYTDWQEVLIGGTSEISDVQASISGGSSGTQFLINGNFHKETTVFPGNYNYRKGNLHANLNHESENKKFHINFSMGYTAQQNNQPGIDITQEAILLPPNAPALYDSQGNLNWENSTWNNPLSNLEGKYTSRSNDLFANSLLSYNILPNLISKISFGFTDTRFDDSRTQPSTMYDPAYGLGSEYSSIYVNNTVRKSWIIEPQISWSKKFGKAKTEVLIGSTFQQQTTNQLVQEANGFSSNSLIYNLSSAFHVFDLVDSESVYKYQAFFGRFNFSLNERYILNFTGRRDGSSRFGPGRQFATFGAIGSAWLFSNETFVKEKLGFLSFGKLRVSYGTTGNDQIGDYQFLDTYGSSGNNYGGVNGLEPTRLFNPNFGWETNKKLELALETGFLKDRIFITAGWYSNRSSNQLVGIPLPATTGFNSIQANLDATVQNRGIELTLRTVNFQKESFNWTSSFNLTIARNKLLSFPDLQGSTYENQFVIGQPLNIKKVYHYTGIDPTTGIYQFEDFNKDGLITAAEDKQSIRDLNPKYFGGFQNTITYKNWQLDFLFQFVNQLNYSGSYSTGLPGAMANQPVTVLNHWQNPGDTATYQQYTTGVNSEAMNAFYKFYASDAMISDASYIRLKNLSLSYTIPEQWLKGVKCRLVFQGQNLFTITSYKGADPESRFTTSLPPLRVFTTGLQLTF
ncbi:SusC/RagA family TonB-linked outer membrane protein [Flavobacterium sp. Fl-318]|uniref:SusC/RagA family TonB-linked outer membrane protein n=1 Tax=Flavobacterium cupriresistens TaxID=2893885 RepID=A0ABU4R5F7_9FLAO|nr:MULTISPECIES: SusC/RagA family TonB-linked outer membrane protein [unclassified Flavobacterium]MDX6187820.1 SusC/RagA family TonB-linked outer membrane protein [Flavobacterium sp. Fl-318]UFH42258.1 SusC/RagA family TonB-linked outer membrane protein [Flavobacterium sp. F-323]